MESIIGPEEKHFFFNSTKPTQKETLKISFCVGVTLNSFTHRGLYRWTTYIGLYVGIECWIYYMSIFRKRIFLSLHELKVGGVDSTKPPRGGIYLLFQYLYRGPPL